MSTPPDYYKLPRGTTSGGFVSLAMECLPKEPTRQQIETTMSDVVMAWGSRVRMAVIEDREQAIAAIQNDWRTGGMSAQEAMIAITDALKYVR